MTEQSAYAAAGVDIEAGDRAVELMKTHVAATRRPEVLGGLGGERPAAVRAPASLLSLVPSFALHVGATTKAAKRKRRTPAAQERSRLRGKPFFRNCILQVLGSPDGIL